MFQFGGLPPRSLWIRLRVPGHCPRRVPPFGHPGIKGRLLLPRDYRGLPRPSSASCAKASAARPWYLRLLPLGRLRAPVSLKSVYNDDSDGYFVSHTVRCIAIARCEFILGSPPYGGSQIDIRIRN